MEKPENIIRIAKFDVWLRNVLTYSQKPPAFRIAMTVKAIAEKTNRKGKEAGMSTRKRQKLVVPDTSLKMTINTSKIKRDDWEPVP